MKTNLLYILSAALLFSIAFSSCGVSNDVVSNKKIQKRKYQKGYFLANKADSKKLDKQTINFDDKTETVKEDISLNEPVSKQVQLAEGTTISPSTDKKEVKLKTLLKSIKEINKVSKEALASDNSKETNSKKTELISGDKVQAKYKAAAEIGDDFKKPSETDLLKLGITLLILGVVLYIVGLIITLGSVGAGSLFFYISYLAWLGGLVCLILYFVNEYDL